MYCMDLTGKVAIVTGGVSGIGRACADALLDCGANVAVIDRAVDSNKKSNDRLFYVATDITERAQVEEMVTKVTNRFGRLDILVNNAGISSMDYTVDIKEEDWDRVMDVNAKGAYLCSQFAARYLQAQGQGGKIINIASQAGKNGYQLMGSYVASKHAVLGLTKVMALELGKDQINVNAVCPGIVETDMKRNERIVGGELRGMDAEAVKREDFSQEDISNVVVFLASTYADYMTGQGINVTGGMTMN